MKPYPLQPECLLAGDLEEICNVVADALVHLLPEVQVMGIKRIVEIEDPGLDMSESAGGARRWRAHGEMACSRMTLRNSRSKGKITAPALAAIPAIMRKKVSLSMPLQKLPSQPAMKLPTKLVASQNPIIIETRRAGRDLRNQR